jgi:hypothetical protein
MVPGFGGGGCGGGGGAVPQRPKNDGLVGGSWSGRGGREIVRASGGERPVNGARNKRG